MCPGCCVVLTHPVHLALIVPHVDVGVHECLVDRDAPLGVDHQHLAEHVPGHRGLQPAVLRAVRREEHVGEELVEGVAGVAGPVLHVVAHGRLQPLHEVWRRRAQLLNHLVPLVNVWQAPRSRTTVVSRLGCVDFVWTEFPELVDVALILYGQMSIP